MITRHLRRRDHDDDQADRDVHRAEIALTRARGLTEPQSSRMLRVRAAELGISLHAAALAVLSTDPPSIA